MCINILFFWDTKLLHWLFGSQRLHETDCHPPQEFRYLTGMDATFLYSAGKCHPATLRLNPHEIILRWWGSFSIEFVSDGCYYTNTEQYCEITVLAKSYYQKLFCIERVINTIIGTSSVTTSLYQTKCSTHDSPLSVSPLPAV